jgi:hypothetical protein
VKAQVQFGVGADRTTRPAGPLLASVALGLVLLVVVAAVLAILVLAVLAALAALFFAGRATVTRGPARLAPTEIKTLSEGRDRRSLGDGSR